MPLQRRSATIDRVAIESATLPSTPLLPTNASAWQAGQTPGELQKKLVVC